jgi:hypothetical protein
METFSTHSMARRSQPLVGAEDASAMSLHDSYGGHLLHVWTRRDAQLRWSWCFAIDDGATTTHDEWFSTAAVALLDGEAAAKRKIDCRVPQVNWQSWLRQNFRL